MNVLLGVVCTATYLRVVLVPDLVCTLFPAFCGTKSDRHYRVGLSLKMISGAGRLKLKQISGACRLKLKQISGLAG